MNKGREPYAETWGKSVPGRRNSQYKERPQGQRGPGKRSREEARVSSGGEWGCSAF